uniref:Ig-like domain-containing protein n=1 Tax=Parascaris equorum TaxID=6256 RepID=A0A914RMM5_PAREQ
MQEILAIAAAATKMKITSVFITLTKKGEVAHQALVVEYESFVQEEAALNIALLTVPAVHLKQEETWTRETKIVETHGEGNVVAVFVEVDANCPDQVHFDSSVRCYTLFERRVCEDKITGFGGGEYNFEISGILQAPKFLKKLKNVTSIIGNALQFKCIVSGTPMPEVRWKYSKVRVNENTEKTAFDPEDPQFISREYETVYEDGVCILRINEVVSEDEGEYTCEATNAAGRATTKCFLHTATVADYDDRQWQRSLSKKSVSEETNSYILFEAPHAEETIEVHAFVAETIEQTPVSSVYEDSQTTVATTEAFDCSSLHVFVDKEFSLGSELRNMEISAVLAETRQQIGLSLILYTSSDEQVECFFQFTAGCAEEICEVLCCCHCPEDQVRSYHMISFSDEVNLSLCMTKPCLVENASMIEIGSLLRNVQNFSELNLLKERLSDNVHMPIARTSSPAAIEACIESSGTDLWNERFDNPFPQEASQVQSSDEEKLYEPRTPLLPQRVTYKGREVVVERSAELLERNASSSGAGFISKDAEGTVMTEEDIDMFQEDEISELILEIIDETEERSKIEELSETNVAEENDMQVVDSSSSLCEGARRIERAIYDVSDRIVKQQPVTEAQAAANEELLRTTLEEVIMDVPVSSNEECRSVYKKPIAFLKQKLTDFENSFIVDEEIEVIADSAENGKPKGFPTTASAVSGISDEQNVAKSTKKQQLSALETMLDESELEELEDRDEMATEETKLLRKEPTAKRREMHSILVQINHELNTVKRYCQKNSKKGTDAIVGVLNKVRNHKQSDECINVVVVYRSASEKPVCPAPQNNTVDSEVYQQRSESFHEDDIGIVHITRDTDQISSTSNVYMRPDIVETSSLNDIESLLGKDEQSEEASDIRI